MKSSGAILYRGPSQLDGAPIVCIAVGLANKSTNRKTGAMLQTYIIRADVGPIDAVKSGADSSICGDCRHRGPTADGKGRTCYVNLGQGPLAVYRAHGRGLYPIAADIAAIGAGRLVRVGTYGDPAAVPVAVWHALLSASTGHTGYTHQWRTTPQLKPVCMASVDTEAEAALAHAFGWRTFRVNLAGAAALMPRESVCPASAEAGKKLTCNACLACNGTATNRRGSIVINAHGGTAVMSHVRKLSEAA